MHDNLIILGGGEHAASVHDAAVQAGFAVLGFTDLEERALDGVPYLGKDDAGIEYADEASFIIGVGMIGPGRLRRIIADRLAPRVKQWARVIHPDATVAASASLGDGVLVMPGAVINAGAWIGDHCIINTGAVVEHHSQIGPFCHLCPRVTTGGGVTIGENSIVGIGATIRDHVSLGSYSFVAMGSVVTKSFPDNSRVLGSPATPGWDFGN
jgi:acetyltransferase EpsM